MKLCVDFDKSETLLHIFYWHVNFGFFHFKTSDHKVDVWRSAIGSVLFVHLSKFMTAVQSRLDMEISLEDSILTSGLLPLILHIVSMSVRMEGTLQLQVSVTWI